MLKDLKSFDNLGTPRYFFELFTALNGESDTVWKTQDIEQMFFNKVYDGRTIHDGCVALATKIELLVISDDDTITLNKNFSGFLNSEKQMANKFVEHLFLTLKEDESFLGIFSSQFISYDVIYGSLQISNSAFSFKYSNFKQLLIDFEVIKIHPTPEIKKYIINSRFKKLFDKTILVEIKKRKIGIDELRNSLEQQQIYGEEADRFVLDYEKTRLNDKKGIAWVAEYSIAEGYDISSFENIDSEINDRFIEVKSYSGQPYFFWSRNEMNVARIKKLSYYLYLIDRKRINSPDYAPMIIKNPYKTVLKNEDEWEQRIEKIRFEFKI